MTNAEISNALSNDERWDVGFGGDLAGYAAADAAATLVGNWAGAMDGGVHLATLVGDVDKVVAILEHFQRQAMKHPELLDAYRRRRPEQARDPS